MTVSFEDIRAAKARIQELVVVTPLLRSRALDTATGGTIFLKAENLQCGGSFKFRGALNRLLCLDEQERKRGVVAFSSGNHALAIAEAARLTQIPAVVIMPDDAPRVKIDGAKKRGAEVVLYDRERDDRQAVSARYVTQHNMTLVPPFDDEHVMAGAGTAALEAASQIPAGMQFDVALVPCSGGGLAAGTALALRTQFPEIEIVVVEPEQFDDTARSLIAGRWIENARKSGSACDALLALKPGTLTLPILQALGASGAQVSDSEVFDAMRFAFSELKLVLEPGGAAALAAALGGKIELKQRNVLVICSGGNVDGQLFAHSVLS